MKLTQTIALGIALLVLPQASAKTELEELRERVAEQDQKIQELEKQVGKKANSSESSGSHSKGEETTKKSKSSDDSDNASKTAHSTSSTKHGKSSTSSDQVYVIKDNDTFTSIAKAHHISVEKLIAANPDVKATELRPGQKIRLSSSASSKTNSTAKSNKKNSARDEESLSTDVPKHGKSYTASSVSSKTNSTAKASVTERQSETPKSQSNPVSTKDNTPPTPASAKKSPETHPVAKESQAELATNDNPTPSHSEKKIRSITIDGPLTYGEFATKHGTTTERLNDLNGLDLTHATVLAKGSELYVPAQP